MAIQQQNTPRGETARERKISALKSIPKLTNLKMSQIISHTEDKNNLEHARKRETQY